MTIQLPRLPTRHTTDELQFWWQQVVEAVETHETTQDELLETLEIATDDLADLLASIISLNELLVDAEEAIENVNEAAEALTASSSLATSFVENFTPPVVSADNAGLVTIANHDRHYGNGTIVAVTGDTLATGEASPTRVHVYYSDAARAGGAVTYQYSTAEADAAQIGDVHSVGAVEIPAAGTQSGGYARPPGYGGFEP